MGSLVNRHLTGITAGHLALSHEEASAASGQSNAWC
jgi:hypothetical protein